MPRIAKTQNSEEYLRIDALRNKGSDKNDCSVVALSLLAAISYEEAAAAMKSAGRKEGEGATIGQITKAFEAVGVPIVRADHRGIINAYPGVHVGLKTVTTHHMRRFPAVWEGAPDFLMWTKGHILAVKGSVVHDWAINRTLRAMSFFIRETDKAAWEVFYAARAGTAPQFYSL